MSLTGEGYSHLCSWPVFMPGFFLFHAGYLIGWVPYMAVMPQIHPSQRSQLAGFTSFVCVSPKNIPCPCTTRQMPVHNQTQTCPTCHSALLTADLALAIYSC